jgi:hypothetical protein
LASAHHWTTPDAAAPPTGERRAFVYGEVEETRRRIASIRAYLVGLRAALDALDVDPELRGDPLRASRRVDGATSPAGDARYIQPR